jgi:hypothetical protein
MRKKIMYKRVYQPVRLAGGWWLVLVLVADNPNEQSLYFETEGADITPIKI